MGVIQNAINQMLGTAGIAARLSPGYETRQELHKLGKQEKAIELQQEALGPLVDVVDYAKAEPSEAASKQFKESEEKLSNIKQKQFELAPTKEKAKEVVMQRSLAGRGSFMTIPADPEEIMQEQAELEASLNPDIARGEQANLRAVQKSEAKQLPKRNFMSFLKNVEIQGGGKVGDLPLNVQQYIAKQYTPSERKKLMNNQNNKESNK